MNNVMQRSSPTFLFCAKCILWSRLLGALHTVLLTDRFKRTSSSLVSIQPRCSQCAKNIYKYPPQSIADYSFTKLSELECLNSRKVRS